MKESKLTEYCRRQGIHLQRGAPLHERCTFKIGGAADLFAQPGDAGQVLELLRLAAREQLPVLVLGRGSNMLFSDSGFRGLVVHMGPGMSAMRLLDDETVYCESGASLNQLCLFAWEHGLGGLEFAYGIPGSVGGAVYMNAGAYGGEIKDVLARAHHVCPRQGPGTLSREALELSYRHSAYAGGDRVITAAEFRLRRDDKAAIRGRMDDYMGRRRESQPLEYPSAGSTFKRPRGAYAAALIDECGLKGLRVGGAMVSEKHAGFVVNAGGATGADVRALMDEVRGIVREKTGYALEPEVRIID